MFTVRYLIIEDCGELNSYEQTFTKSIDAKEFASELKNLDHIVDADVFNHADGYISLEDFEIARMNHFNKCEADALNEIDKLFGLLLAILSQ